MDSLPSLISFVRAAHEGSFAAAARSLGLSRAAVGQSVSRLEEQLGVRLIARSTRSFVLTEQGERLLAYCEDAVATLERASDIIERESGEVSGTLKVSVSGVLGRNVLMPIIGELLATHEDLEVDLRFDEGYVDLVGGGFDVALRIGTLDDAAFIARKLFDIKMVVFGSPDYLQRRGRPETPEDLANHDCIGFRLQSSGDHVHWDFGGDASPGQIRARLSVDEPGAVISAAVNGLGIAQMAHYAVEKELEAGLLEEVLASSTASQRSVYAIYPVRAGLPPKTRVFIDRLLEHTRRWAL